MRSLANVRSVRWLMPSSFGAQAVVSVGWAQDGQLAVSVNDAFVLSIAQPGLVAPWVESLPFGIGAEHAVVAARSIGGTVECDVFCDGYSVDDGRPIDDVRLERAPDRPGRAILLDPTAGPRGHIQAIRMLPIAVAVITVWLLASSGRGFHPVIIGVCALLALVVGAVISLITIRLLEILATPPRVLHDSTASLMLLLCVEADIVALVLVVGSLIKGAPA